MPDIARDAATDGGNNGGTTTSRTFAHTCSGSGRYLFVPVKGGLVSDGDLVTGATYDGVEMTLIGKRSPGGAGTEGNRWIYLFGLKNPTSGTHNVVVSSSANVYILAGAVSYTGADQTSDLGAIDVSGDGSTLTVVNTLTLTVSVTATGCWLVSVMGWFNASFHMTAGAAPTTHVVDDVNFGTWSFFDSDGPVGTGSQSLEGVGSGVSDGLNGIIAALKPDTGTPVALLLGQEMM